MTAAELSLWWPVFLASSVGASLLLLAGARLGAAGRRALDEHNRRVITDLQSALLQESFAGEAARADLERLRAEHAVLAQRELQVPVREKAAQRVRDLLQQKLSALESERRSTALALRSLHFETSKTRDEQSQVASTLNRDLAVQTEVARGQKQELSQVRDELATLRNAHQDLDGLRSTVAFLSEENRDLTSRMLEAGAPVPPQAAPLYFGSDSSNSGAVLQGMVERIKQLEGIQAAVLGDEIGLVVASAGVLDEELAAIGAMLVGAMAPARQVLPLGGLRRVTLEDDHNTKVTARRLVTKDDHVSSDLVLVTLASGAEPPDTQLFEAIETIRRLGETGVGHERHDRP